MSDFRIEFDKLSQAYDSLEKEYEKDVFSLKKENELLTQTLQNYEAFFNTLEDFLFVLDEQGHIIHINSTVKERLKYSQEELLGQSILMVHPLERREEAGRIVDEMLHGSTTVCPVPIVTKSGTQIPVETRVTLGSWDGKPAIFGISKDISKIKLSEEKFSKLFYINPLACELSDLENHTYLEVNEAFYTFFGFEKDEVIGKTAIELGIATQNTISEIRQKEDSNGMIRNAFAELRAKSGEMKQVLLSAENIYVQDKKYRFTVVFDITLNEKLGKELEESKEKYRGLSEAAFESIFLSERGLCIEQNHTAETIFGYTTEEATVRYGTDWIVPEDREMVMKNMLSGLEVPYEATALRKDGSTFPCMLRGKMMQYKGKIVRVTSLTDITNLKRTSNALRESEEKYRLIAENTSDGIIIFGADRCIQYVSPAYLKQLGYEETEQLQRTQEGIFDLIHPNDRDKVFAEIFSAIELKESELIYFYRVRHKAGHYIWREDNAKFKYDDTGNYDGAYVICRDITERKRSEEILRVKDWAIESAINAITITDLASNFTYANPAFLKLWGYQNLEEILGKSSFELGMVDEKAQILLKKLHEDGHFSGELIAKSKDGKLFDVLSEASLVTDGEGQPHSLLASFVDITERKKAESELKKLAYAVEQSPASIIITDLNGNMVYVNSKVPELTGYSKEELLSSNAGIFGSGQQNNDSFGTWWKKITSGIEWRCEMFNKKKNGDHYWESSTISPIVDSEGNTTNYLIVKEDITDRKKLIESLNIALRKAEESDKLKSAFLANMSHEIRTPMNGILGFASLLKEPNLTGKDHEEFIHIIEKSGARMLNIINDLIDISKVEAGQMELVLTKTDLNNQLEFLYNFFMPEARKKGLDLIVHCKLSKGKSIVHTDREKIYAILTNLIKNALKFTYNGSIEFGCEEVNDKIQFFVRDTGIGISQAKHNLIFERFVQADLKLSRGYEGAGLGLSISKAYVEMLGGEIWLNSNDGDGSCFYFTIPATYDNSAEMTAIREDVSPPDSFNGDATILIVEDDSTSSLYLQNVLKDIYNTLLFAETGEEAVEICRVNPGINLVLMDIKLPVMDGYTAAKLIKVFRPDLPILAQTAFALKSEIKDIGSIFDAYCTKPINAEELRIKIKLLLL